VYSNFWSRAYLIRGYCSQGLLYVPTKQSSSTQVQSREVTPFRICTPHVDYPPPSSISNEEYGVVGPYIPSYHPPESNTIGTVTPTDLLHSSVSLPTEQAAPVGLTGGDREDTRSTVVTSGGRWSLPELLDSGDTWWG